MGLKDPGGALTTLQAAKVGALTVPIAYDDDRPLTAADLPSSIGSDVKLAINVDEGVASDASASSHTLTLEGAAAISTAQAFIGGSSSIHNTTTGDRTSVDQSVDFNPGAGDFLAEIAIYPTGTAPYTANLIVKWGNGSSDSSWGCSIIDVSGQKMRFSYTTDGDALNEVNIDFDVTLVKDTWHHLRWVRKSNVLYGFLDGKLTGSAALTATIADVSYQLDIGDADGATDTFIGYIDAVRFQKGGTVSADEFDVLRVPFSGATVAYQPEIDTKELSFSRWDPTTDVVTSASDAFYSYGIRPLLNGYCISAVNARHDVAGSGGTASNIKIKKNGADILSTDLTIDSTELDSDDAVTDAVIDRTQNVLATGDVLTFLLTAADTTTVPKGLSVTLTLKN